MIQLSKDNLKDYLISKALIQNQENVSVEELGGGVSNVVLKVKNRKTSFVVKQALPKLRVKDEWYSDVDRVFTETNCIRLLTQILYAGMTPKVLFEDRENFLFIMTAAPEDAVPWKKKLLEGYVDRRIGVKAGSVLAEIHKKTFHYDPVSKDFASDRAFIQLRVEPYHWTIARRHPDIRLAVDSEVLRMLETKIVLTHGDYSPKNILVKDNDILLLDFEVAHYGDPAFDLAFCLNHIFLKSIKNYGMRERYFDLALAFWNAYISSAESQQEEMLMKNTVKEIGCLMLARIDGKSPVEYINDEKTKNMVRSTSKSIILGSQSSLDDVIESIDEGLKLLPC